MLNQLPKNLNQNSFNKEKHINLLDSLPGLRSEQEHRVVNFFLFISIFFSILSFLISYLNLTSFRTTENVDEFLSLNFIIDDKKEYTSKLKEEVLFLTSYKKAVDSIQTKKYPFFNDIIFLQNSLKNSKIQQLNYTYSENNYIFKITLLSSSEDITTDVNKIMEQNRRFKNLKIESLQKIENNQTEFILQGEIDGR